jgi:hypothetical protein
MPHQRLQIQEADVTLIRAVHRREHLSREAAVSCHWTCVSRSWVATHGRCGDECPPHTGSGSTSGVSEKDLGHPWTTKFPQQA